MVDSREKNNGGWKEFRPSKTMWFWSSVGVFIVTTIVGFGWGGWVTGGTARQMADEAADKARAQLIADVCVHRYVHGEGFANRLAKLKEGNSWDRQELIEDGNWTKLPGIKDPVDEAADLCANELAGMKIPEEPTSETVGKKAEKTG